VLRTGKLIWPILYALILSGFGVACLLSVRSACLAALTMLREYLASDLRGEIIHLRAQVAAKDEQLLAVAHPTTQAVLTAQKAPQKPYAPEWDTSGARPRNPMQFVVARPGDDS
jgi:hypothetical protein